MRSLTLVNRGKADFDLGGKFRRGLDVAADLVEPEERNRGFNGDWGIVKVAQGGGRVSHVLFVAASGARKEPIHCAPWRRRRAISEGTADCRIHSAACSPPCRIFLNSSAPTSSIRQKQREGEKCPLAQVGQIH